MTITPLMEDNYTKIRELLRVAKPVSVVRLKELAANLGRNHTSGYYYVKPFSEAVLDKTLRLLVSSELESLLREVRPTELLREESLDVLQVASKRIEAFSTPYGEQLTKVGWRDSKEWLSAVRQGDYYTTVRSTAPARYLPIAQAFERLLAVLEDALRSRNDACVRRRGQLERRAEAAVLRAELKDSLPLSEAVATIGASVPADFPLSEVPVCSRSGRPYTYSDSDPVEIGIETPDDSVGVRIKTWGQLCALQTLMPEEFTSEVDSYFVTEGNQSPKLFVPRVELARRVIAFTAKRVPKGS